MNNTETPVCCSVLSLVQALRYIPQIMMVDDECPPLYCVCRVCARPAFLSQPLSLKGTRVHDSRTANASFSLLSSSRAEFRTIASHERPTVTLLPSFSCTRLVQGNSSDSPDPEGSTSGSSSKLEPEGSTSDSDSDAEDPSSDGSDVPSHCECARIPLIHLETAEGLIPRATSCPF